MTVTIQVAGQGLSRLEGESHSIGSDARCAIQIAGKDVAPRHALLRRVAGRWLVEAAGDQLIRIGDGRPTKLAWLNPGDEIYFSTDGPPVIFEPADSGAPARPLPAVNAPRAGVDGPVTPAGSAQAPSSPVPSNGERQPLWFAVGGAGLLATGILLTVLILNLSGAFQRVQAPTENGETKSGSTADANIASTSASVDDQHLGTSSDKVAVSAPTAAAALTDAVYLVQVRASGGQQIYRLGTAWAVSPRKLVTSAAVAAGIQSLREVAPEARIVSADGRQVIAIRSFKLHPAYESALKQAGEAQSEAEGLRLELEQAPADVNLLTERLIAAEERHFQAFERQTAVDLAVVEVDGVLTHPLPVMKAGSPLKAGNRVRMEGFPFRPDDFIVDPDQSSAVSTIVATVGTVPQSGSNGPSYWRIRSGTDLGTDNWSGSPIIDSQGHVVGIYSRPTPPPPGRAPPETWILHDIADAQALAAFGESW